MAVEEGRQITRDILNILHLEDDPKDAELIFAHLCEGFFDCHITRVVTCAEYLAALDSKPFDLILADYSLPMFDGLSALTLARERGIETPFILVSGALGEEVAIETLKRGATDYVLKQRLERLVPAVQRALREAGERDERRVAERALLESAERMRFMMESMPQKIFTARPNGEMDYFNEQWMEFTGLSFDQIKDWGWTQFIHPEDLEETVRCWRQSIDTGEPFQMEHRFQRADGVFRWHLSRAQALCDASGKIRMWIGSNTDVDEQKRAAEALRASGRDSRSEQATTARGGREPSSHQKQSASPIRDGGHAMSRRRRKYSHPGNATAGHPYSHARLTARGIDLGSQDTDRWLGDHFPQVCPRKRTADDAGAGRWAASHCHRGG